MFGRLLYFALIAFGRVPLSVENMEERWDVADVSRVVAVLAMILFMVSADFTVFA